MKIASLRMDRLICDLLSYSSLLHAEVPMKEVNVPDLLQRLLDENPTLRAQKSCIQVENAMPMVRGNDAVLTQCFSALLDNAFRYSRPGFPVKVRVWAELEEGWTKLFVEDNGSGMSQQFQQRLFGIFQKGTHAQEGTGIGLALVRVAVERMGGHVGVKSEEGKGSRFWIQLRPAEWPLESKSP
jgi:signal transduction histidine kinase